jgi:serine/threonine protein kinase
MDFKPDNIFLTMDSPPIYKLGDFGIVVSLEEKVNISNLNIDSVQR